jgi:hypothetical protein
MAKEDPQIATSSASRNQSPVETRNVIARALRHGERSVNGLFQIDAKRCGEGATLGAQHIAAAFMPGSEHGTNLASGHSGSWFAREYKL